MLFEKIFNLQFIYLNLSAKSVEGKETTQICLLAMKTIRIFNGLPTIFCRTDFV